MAFDIHLHIAEDSRRGQVIKSMAAEQHISPEEATERLLEEAIELHTKLSPAEQMWGAFSSPEDSEVVDEAMKHVRMLRETDKLRDFGT